MPREVEWHPYFAWWPTMLDDGGWAWLRWVERRKWFLGPRTEALGDVELMQWRYRSARSRES